MNKRQTKKYLKKIHSQLWDGTIKQMTYQFGVKKGKNGIPSQIEIRKIPLVKIRN